MGDFLISWLDTIRRTGHVKVAGLVFLVLVVILADVWIFGTLAAWLVGLYKLALGSSMWATPVQQEAAKHAFDHVSWYWNHPFRVALAWLTKSSSELSLPEVRATWLALNGIIFAAGLGYLGWTKFVEKFVEAIHKKDVGDRDIRNLKFKKISFNWEKEVKKVGPDRVFLGLDDNRRPVTISWKDLTEHVHVLGGSGTGKTSLIVLPICLQAIRAGLPVCVVDQKGDLQASRILEREARARGKKFYFFSLHPGARSNSYNPLLFGDAVSRAERVMAALELLFEGEARFYSYYQKSIFIPLLRYFRSAVTLKDIHDVLRDRELLEEIICEKVSAQSIKGLAAALTQFVALEHINDPNPDIDLRSVVEQGDVVYFDLRSAIAPDVSCAVGKMIMFDIQHIAAFRCSRDQVLIIAIDEFQNIACRAFTNIISKIRSANCALILSHQALGDLRAVGDDFLNTVMTNTSTTITFCVQDPDDAEFFAKRSGKVVVPKINMSRSATGESVSESEDEKEMIHRNVLMRVPFGKSVMYKRGALATLLNHAHVISEDEKNILESEYPQPEKVEKARVKTAQEEIERLKYQILEKKKQKARAEAAAASDESPTVEVEEIAL